MISSAILPPMLRVAGSPFLRAVAAHVSALRVRCDLVPVIFSAVTAVAAGVAAHRLHRLIFRWLEDPLTIPASPFDHTGGFRRHNHGPAHQFRYRHLLAGVNVGWYNGYEGTMVKRLRKHGNSLALVIDPPILDLLKIDTENFEVFLFTIFDLRI